MCRVVPSCAALASRFARDHRAAAALRIRETYGIAVPDDVASVVAKQYRTALSTGEELRWLGIEPISIWIRGWSPRHFSDPDSLDRVGRALNDNLEQRLPLIQGSRSDPSAYLTIAMLKRMASKRKWAAIGLVRRPCFWNDLVTKNPNGIVKRKPSP